jgi:hypothetical protein
MDHGESSRVWSRRDLRGGQVELVVIEPWTAGVYTVRDVLVIRVVVHGQVPDSMEIQSYRMEAHCFNQ